MAELLAAIIITAYPKSYCGDIAHNLRNEEFKCRCAHKSCDHTVISAPLVKAWNELRDTWGRPIQVTSGHRCAKYNDDIRAQGFKSVKDSNHIKGLAIDIDVSQLSHAEYVELAELTTEIFDFVIHEENYFHLQINR